MNRTILVPASGSETDAVVFETALAAARPCQAHLEFFHVRVSAGEALRYTPHASFARGKALRGVLHELEDESKNRWQAAQRHVRDFCKQHKITMADAPPARLRGMSASWREEPGNGEEPFITRARIHDLVVMGRFTRPNGLPPNLLPLLLVECGRPMLIAAAQAPRRLGTIMVAWKDAREPARALTAAMPLLIEAERIVIAEILDGHPSANDAATVAAQLRWHGLQAEPRTIRADGHRVAALLSAAAEACSADLLVMGSYSTGPVREEIFGGCTKSMLDHAPVPVFVL
jgi:nucleotide-binding universal stress UspA family protein